MGGRTFYRALMVAVSCCLLHLFPATAQPASMKCVTMYPPTSLHTKGVAKFADLVKEYTNGSIVIEVQMGGDVGYKGPELLKVVQSGSVSLAQILMGTVQESEPVFGISSLPRAVKSYEEAFQFAERAKPLYEKAATRWHQKILYFYASPPSGLYTDREVVKPADFKGLKVRTYDSNGVEFMNALGGSAVNLPLGEIPPTVSSPLR